MRNVYIRLSYAHICRVLSYLIYVGDPGHCGYHHSLGRSLELYLSRAIKLSTTMREGEHHDFIVLCSCPWV